MPPLLTRDFALVVIAHFLQALGFSALILLPVYLEHIQADRTAIGTIMAMEAVGGLLSRPLVGWALDTFGRKPTVLVGTLLAASAMGLLLAVRGVGGLVYFDRIVFGIGEGALFTGYFALASDIVPVERRTEGLAIFGISGLVPLAVGPVAEQLGVQPTELPLFFALVGVLVLLSLPFLWGIREPSHIERKPLVLRAVLGALARPALWPPWLATLLLAGLVSAFFAFATVTAGRRGLEDPATPLFLTYAGVSAAVRVFGGRLPDRVGTANMVVPALAFYVGSAALLSQTGTWSGFLAAGALAGLGHGLCFPVLASQVVTRAPDHLRGSALATFTALWSSATLLVTPAMGALSDAADDGLMWSTASVVALCGAAAWAGLEHRLGHA